MVHEELYLIITGSDALAVISSRDKCGLYIANMYTSINYGCCVAYIEPPIVLLRSPRMVTSPWELRHQKVLSTTFRLIPVATLWLLPLLLTLLLAQLGQCSTL